MLTLTDTNYHSPEANREYWSVSLFKAFKDCPAAAMAELDGSYKRPTTDALIIGQYIDAHFSGTMGQWSEEHPEIFNSRSGELKAPYRKANAAIKRVERDPLFVEYIGGDSQVIMTGELFGLPWKVKIDSLHDDKIVDLKYMKDKAPIYKNGERMPFWQAYGYDLQGYIYQAIAERVTGKHLPFYLALVTKEDPADIDVFEIPDKYLKVNKGMVEHYLPEFQKIKEGRTEPTRCGSCPYCRESKVLSAPVSIETLFED